MRRPYFAPETFHHIVLRGARGMDIFCDKNDWWNCIRALFYLNDSSRPEYWGRELEMSDCGFLERPAWWPEREPFVAICTYCLHSNHLHLVVKELKEGGISAFMSRLPKNLTHYFNGKYGGSGSIFQGPYKARLIASDADLRIVTLYVTVKNVMERYPGGGIDGAVANVGEAFRWASEDAFSSFPDYGAARNSPIVDKDIIGGQYATPKKFLMEAENYLMYRHEKETACGGLALE